MSDNWYRMYEVARNYYLENNNLEIPTKYITEDGVKIGVWISNQRRNYKNKKLSEEQIELLNAIGMLWKKEVRTWEEMYELAKNYYEHYQNLKINKYFITKNGYDYDEDGLKLGIWIRQQRKTYKTNKISKERKEKLESIGMVWDMNKESWYKMYELAARYYEKNKNLQIPIQFKTKDGITYDKDGYKLGIWISNQRQIYNSYKDENRRKQKLSSHRIFLLNDIGMIWDASLDYDKRWEEMYKLASKYYFHHKKLDVPVNFKTKNGYSYDNKGESLGIWIQNQRRAYKAWTNKKYAEKFEPLSKEKQEKLEMIGMIWNIYDYNWEKNYEIAKNYYNNYGNLEVSTTFKTIDGYKYNEQGMNLYNWLNQQRRAYKNVNKDGKALTQEQINLLNAINMPWELKDKNEEKWMSFYKLAENYYKYYNDLNIKNNFRTTNGYDYDENGEKLGAWIKRQRYDYKTGNLSENRIELLNNIGMIWQKIEKKSRLEKVPSYNPNIDQDLAYQELIAKINLLEIVNEPVMINGKPHPIFYMGDGELLKKYNISLENLIYNFYTKEKSEEIKERINNPKILLKSFIK